MNDEKVLKLSENEYKGVCFSILNKLGVNEEEAKPLVENLYSSDLHGISSHGLNNLDLYVDFIEERVINPHAKPEVINESSSIALVDGNGGFGQTCCVEAAKLAVKKAKETMNSSIGVKNCGHVGYIGYYARIILEEGLIGIMYVNSSASVAPYGGKRPIIGTNPISYALPAGKEDPIVADFATSATAAGYIKKRISEGKNIPKGWALDSLGYEVIDPRKLFRDTSTPLTWENNFVGSLQPAAGHKGYALGLVVDVLAGALTGGSCDGDIIEGKNYAFLQAINPDGFVSREQYNSRIDKLIRTCRNSLPRPGFEEVLVPGDPERRSKKESLEKGIPISSEMWKSIEKLGCKYGINVNKFLESKDSE